MNIRQLEIYTAVADRESITKAANYLYLTQPAVSKTIRELEQDVGVQLFDRRDNKLHLNAAGQAFRLRAQRLLQEWHALADFGTTQARELPLRIGTSLTFGQNSLPGAVRRFKLLHPETPLKLYAENVAQIKQRLLRGDIDLAFIEGDARGKAFSSTLISRYELLVLAAPHFDCPDVMSVSELLALPLLLREKGSTLRDCFDEGMHHLGVDAEPMLESVNTAVLVNAARSGLGITVLPEPLAQSELKAETLRRVRVEGLHLMTDNYAVALRSAMQGQLQQDMLTCFVQENG